MIQLSYELSFDTPAFLGNAEQSAQWRTPPIKALLRQWWRVAYAAEHSRATSVSVMRQAEGCLFGVAADKESESSKSLVRIRLDHWNPGTLKTWIRAEHERVAHGEVRNREGKPGPVDAHLYMGYGPLEFKQGTSLKAAAAIQAKESGLLRLAVPTGIDAGRLDRALALMNLFGTLGGRSRNGWGSFRLKPQNDTPALTDDLPAVVTLPWRQALAADWPQAIGTDERGPLVWRTATFGDWRAAMVQLAKIKIATRTRFKFPDAHPDGQVHARHWLSYPVTRHDVNAWKRDNLRLPNSLRFKVRREAEGKFHGVIFHMPCLPPTAFRPERRDIEAVWKSVHELLDLPGSGLNRIPA